MRQSRRTSDSLHWQEQQSETFLGDKSDTLIKVNKGKDRKRNS